MNSPLLESKKLVCLSRPSTVFLETKFTGLATKDRPKTVPKTEAEEQANQASFEESLENRHCHPSNMVDTLIAVARRRLADLGASTDEAIDIAHHVLGRAEYLFQTKALPAYEVYGGDKMPVSELGRSGSGYWKLPTKSQWSKLLNESENLGEDYCGCEWIAGDGEHEHAIRFGHLIHRVRKLCLDSVDCGGYHLATKGILRATRGGNKPSALGWVEGDEVGLKKFACPTKRYDSNLHSPVVDEPETVNFGPDQLLSAEALICSKLSASTLETIERLESAKPLTTKRDDQTRATWLKAESRARLKAEAEVRNAIKSYLADTVYAD